MAFNPLTLLPLDSTCHLYGFQPFGPPNAESGKQQLLFQPQRTLYHQTGCLLGGTDVLHLPLDGLDECRGHNVMKVAAARTPSCVCYLRVIARQPLMQAQSTEIANNNIFMSWRRQYGVTMSGWWDVKIQELISFPMPPPSSFSASTLKSRSHTHT